RPLNALRQLPVPKEHKVADAAAVLAPLTEKLIPIRGIALHVDRAPPLVNLLGALYLPLKRQPTFVRVLGQVDILVQHPVATSRDHSELDAPVVQMLDKLGQPPTGDVDLLRGVGRWSTAATVSAINSRQTTRRRRRGRFMVSLLRGGGLRYND